MQDYHIYCHIPFCKKRCRYCYFTAKFKEHEMVNLKNLDSYVDALVKNISETDIANGQLQSIVFGGGTPSLLNKDQLHKIIDAIHSKVSDAVFEKLQHMAYEVSPDTASLETLSSFRNVGFNRISIGVQSFDDNELKILGRPYNNKAIKDAMTNIRKLKYDLINVDLLIGIPGQTKESIIFSVNEALMLRPEHLSISLFYKSYPGGSDFVEDCEKKGYKILDIDDKIEVYEEICMLIKDAGYERIDNTVFSLPGYIFTYEKDSICGTEAVLAFGPGSSGYWNGVIRYTPPEIEKYIEKPECVCKGFSVETNAYATIWGHLNAYGYIKEDEIIKNFNLNIEQLIKQDFSVEKLIVSLKNYNLIDCLDKKYCIRPEAINKAIVIMQHCKDEWGYRLITAPNKLQTEVRK